MLGDSFCDLKAEIRIIWNVDGECRDAIKFKICLAVIVPTIRSSKQLMRFLISFDDNSEF